MKHPEWALKHKTKNTELRHKNGKYTLNKITSIWCPEKKRTKKVTLEYLGTITEEHGLIAPGLRRRGRVPAGESIFKNPPKQEAEFIDHFASIEDERSSRNQLHSVSEIFLLTICGVICGADGWKDIEIYGKAQIRFLRKYLDYKNGIPSEDTIRRFFRSINPSHFEQLFRQWLEGLAKKCDVKVIAIDGKSSRHSFDKDGNMLHMISAFATEARIVLGQEKVSDKSNEINAIPKMLEWLDVKDHIVTIDAMGCQYKIADQITQKEGNYIFALKGNQENLSEDVKLFFEEKKNIKSLQSTDYDKAHGRIEERKCTVVSDVTWLRKRHPKWHSIKSIIKIESTREIGDKITEETRYYISSLDDTAEVILKAIRSHWAIENSLHWVLDMSFNEDYSRIRKENAPHVMAIIRHIALNMLQLAKEAKQSIKGMRKECGWDNELLEKVITTKSS